MPLFDISKIKYNENIKANYKKINPFSICPGNI